MAGGPVRPRSAVLVVPGLGLDGRSWAPTLRHLGRPADVVLLPGYGLPCRPGVDPCPAALAGRVLEHLPTSGRVVLVAHSSGCQVAAHAARAAPAAVAALVLVGPTTDPGADRWRDLVVRWLRTAAHEDPRQVPELVRQYAATGLSSIGRAMEAARHDRIERVLDQVRSPVLVLRGRHDRICPEGWAAGLGPSTTLSRGAHMIPWTHGQAVARRLQGVLDVVGTRAAGPRL